MVDAVVIAYPCGCLERVGDFKRDAKGKLVERASTVCAAGEKGTTREITNAEGETLLRWQCDMKNARENEPKKTKEPKEDFEE